MGGAFLGPFVAGLSGTLQQAQQRQTEQEYKKALVEHSKLQTKMLENKLNLADQEQGMMRAYLATKGIQLPPPPAPAQIAQPEQQPQSLLGRLFNPQPPTPQPTAATQPPLAQTIAQGQMQGQMPGIQAQSQPNQAFLEDYMGKKLFDLPPWRERFEAESGQVGRTVNTMGQNGQPITIVIDKRNKPMGVYPTPAEPYRQQVTTPQGTYMYELPKYGSGGASGPVMQTAPPEMTRTKIKTNFGDFEVMEPKFGTAGTTTQTAPAGEGMTSDRAGKINLIGNAMDRLPEIQALIYPNGQLDRSILAKGKNPLGIPIGSGATLYSKMYQAMESALRMETGAQANPSEIDTKVKEYWPNAYDTESAIQEKLGDMNKYINGAANTIDPTGELRKIRKTGNVPTGTTQGKPSLNLGSGLTANQIEQEYQQALKKRPDLAPQLKAKRDQLMQQVR